MATARGAARGIAGFVFGFASTVLLVGLWGRAVVVDTDQLADSLSPMARSETVVDRFTSWMSSELEGVGLDPVTADAASDHVLGSPAVSEALSDVLFQVVMAAASTDAGGSTVDAANVFAPAVPEITANLNEVGVAVDQDQVSDVVSDLDPIVVRDPEAVTWIGPDSEVASKLGTAVVLAVIVMLIAGWAYVGASHDHRKAVRSLCTRFALGALSFALFLRIGSWVLDPGGGRAPVVETVGRLAASKWMVPLIMGVVAATGALVFWLFRKRKVRRVTEPLPEVPVVTNRP